MGNLTIATTFIVILNLLMWFSGIAMIDINPDGSICYTGEGSIIDSSISGSASVTNNNYSVLDNDVLDQLPGSAQVSTGSSGIFTDVFNSILSWFKSTPGIKYLYGVVASPYNVLSCMNLPAQFTVGLGTLWYLISFLVLISFLWGSRE